MLTQKNLLVFLIITLNGCTISLNAQSRQENKLQAVIEKFRNRIEKDVKFDNVKGSISFTIIAGNQIICSDAYGLADINTNKKADSSTIYRIGSISKSFTAFLMMQLVQEKIIKLNEPIEIYLPEITKLKGYSNSTSITFQQLASHTSGLSREPKWKNAASGSIADWEAKVLASIPKTSIKHQPGKRFKYSNIGYGILGLALSRAANKPYIELVKEKIFLKLNMTNSYFIVPENKMANLAKGVKHKPKGEIDTIADLEHKGRGYKVPNGGIYSTPNDLAKFMMANMGYSEILNRAHLDLAHTSKTRQTGSILNYGLGFFLSENRKVSIVSHGGSVAGYTCSFAFEKESKYGIILMRNYNWGITILNLRNKKLLRKLKKL